MAGKKKKKNNGSKNIFKRIFAFFKDDRLRYAAGIILLLAAIFLFLVFISYLFNWKSDQDFRWSDVFSGPEVSVNNQGGKVGAWLSDLFLNRWFGLPGFLFPVILVVLALSLYRVRIVKTWKFTQNSLILVILLSIAFGLIFGDAEGWLGSGPGGSHGYFLSRWLIALLGYFGTAFLLLISFTALLLFSTDLIAWLRKLKIRKPFDGIFSDASSKDDTDLEFSDNEPDDQTDENEPFIVSGQSHQEHAEDREREEVVTADPVGANGVIMTVKDLSGNDNDEY
ncbi:MAG TPA: hypothetical protein ENN61_06785, partial [Bacteroidaceae bacterium]|nr:hypothetical protein [Bacteroidaceae bacterium]